MMKQENRPMLQLLNGRCLFTFIFRGRFTPGFSPTKLRRLSPCVFSCSVLLFHCVLHCLGSFCGFLSSVKRELLYCQTSYAVVRTVLTAASGGLCVCVYVSAFTVGVLNCLGCAFVDCCFWKEVGAVSKNEGRLYKPGWQCTKEGKKLVVCFDVPCFICFFSEGH